MSIEKSTLHRLGEHVRAHVLRGDVLEHDLAIVDVLLDEGVPDDDVLAATEARVPILHEHG